MNLGLVGSDQQTLALAKAADGLGHRIVFVDEAVPSDDRKTLNKLASGADSGSWEDLLHRSDLTVVLVASAPEKDIELRSEQLRKLVQAGVPLLVSHPVLPVMLTHYELDMLRREAGGVLRSYVFGQGHPLLAKIAAFARGDPDLGIGKPEQFVFERRTEHRDRQSVLHQLTCDIALLMEVIGTIDRVAAMGSRHEEPDFSRMTVQLSGPLGVVGRWGVEPVENVPQRRLSLIGEQGRAVLLIPDDAEHGEWSLEVSHAGEQQVADAQQWSSATHAVNQLEVAIDHGDNGECWSRACQSAELAEAAEQCLARGRTIELHFEEHSPQATFKGQMATWGCVLMLAVLSMMCIAGMLGLRLARVLDFWPAGLLALLLLFLAVQALPKLFPESKPEKLKDE